MTIHSWILLLLGMVTAPLLTLTDAQILPQCFTDAVNTGNIECYDEDLTSVNQDTLASIPEIRLSTVRCCKVLIIFSIEFL